MSRPNSEKKQVSPLMVILAFGIVYIVWGSTYLFIQKAVHEFPPFLMGAIRFLIAGGLMLAWCIIRGENVWNPVQVKHAAISGLLLLLIGNGAVIWTEQTLPSSLVAVLVSSVPIWFVVLDKPHWKENFSSRETLIGLFVGFAGVILLFYQRISQSIQSSDMLTQFGSLLILLVGSISWAAGSLYSKSKSVGSATVNTAWQMFSAGIAFLPLAFLKGETSSFKWAAVSAGAWVSIGYLIVFGSLIGYSAYIWLLQVRSATQVSTHGYVNPVVAVVLGVFFAGESMGWMQILGLAIILTSVLLINIAKVRKEKRKHIEQTKTNAVVLKREMAVNG